MSEQMVDAFWYGSHLHYVGMKACKTCRRENAAFMALWDEIGTAELDKRIEGLPATKRFYQALPYENWAYQEDMDSAGVDNGESLFKDATPPAGDPATLYADAEAVEALLQPLNDSERHIIVETINGNKPKEIAINLGHKNSNMVRLGKYEAKRKLGVPVLTQMRRNGKEDEV